MDAPCLDCGEPLTVTVKDGKIEHADPVTMVSFIDVPFNDWRKNRPYS